MAIKRTNMGALPHGRAIYHLHVVGATPVHLLTTGSGHLEDGEPVLELLSRARLMTVSVEYEKEPNAV